MVIFGFPLCCQEKGYIISVLWFPAWFSFVFCWVLFGSLWFSCLCSSASPLNLLGYRSRSPLLSSWFSLGPSWCYLGAILVLSWGYLGAILVLWGYLGAISGPSWCYLGAILGPYWCYLGAISSSLWRFGAISGPSWCYLGETSGSNFSRCAAHLENGRFWGHLGAILVLFWGHVGPLWI